MRASAKFKAGDRVRPSDSNPRQFELGEGTIVGFGQNNPRIVRIHRDSMPKTSVEPYHMDFWDVIKEPAPEAIPNTGRKLAATRKGLVPIKKRRRK